MYNFSRLIAEKLINYISVNYPNYILKHPRFTVSNLSGEIYSFLIAFIIVVIIPLSIFIIYRLHERKYNHTSYINYVDNSVNNKRYSIKRDPIFNKKSIIVFGVLFILVSFPFALEFISGYKNQEFTDGFSLSELAYSPGNQPITDEIVQAMNENVIPEVIKTGEAIAEIATNPELTSEIIEEVTGVDTSSITNN